jgi:hypothetical protein
VKKEWKKRWFSMQGNSIFYAKSENGSVLNSILIDENTFVEVQKLSIAMSGLKKIFYLLQINPNEFMLVQACAFAVGNRARPRVYYLSAEKPEEKFRWITAIRAGILIDPSDSLCMNSF